MTARRQSLGRAGEEAAAAFYRHHGYEVLDRNWRVKEGELDIIATRDGEIVFAEVKTRSSDRFGTGAEAVTLAKQRRIRKLAILWMKASGRRGRRMRFDVIEVDGRLRITPYKSAF